MARTLRFPLRPSPPPPLEPAFGEFDTDTAIGISIGAAFPSPPVDPTLDVVLGKDGHTHHYRIFEQEAAPGAWTLTTQADDRPAHVEPIESRDDAGELALMLREQIAEQLREGWHVIRSEGLTS